MNEFADKMRPQYLAQRASDLRTLRFHTLSMARRLYDHYAQLGDEYACRAISDHIRQREPSEDLYSEQ